jgi:hypothetical protein
VMASPRLHGQFAFKIGDAFPAEDPIARFLVVLAMMSNDLLRLVDVMLVDEGEDAALHLFCFRVRLLRKPLSVAALMVANVATAAARPGIRQAAGVAGSRLVA